MTKDYYKILGVEKTASEAEIKKAYRGLAVEHHPDKGGDEDKFKEINEAYSVLHNPQKRQDYDNPASANFNFFEHMAHGFGPFGRPMPSKRPTNVPSKGQDLKFVINVSIRDFIFGETLHPVVSYDEACSSCNGKGYTESKTCDECQGQGSRMEVRTGQGINVQTVIPCSKCRGTGELADNSCESCGGSGKHRIENKKYEVPLKKGVRDGYVFVIQNRGRKGVFGGPDGDVYIKCMMNLPDPESLTKEQKKVLEEL